MKNITFFDQMKCILREESIKNIDLETKAKEEETKTEDLKQQATSKLNFNLFDIDQVFAN